MHRVAGSGIDFNPDVAITQGKTHCRLFHRAAERFHSHNDWLDSWYTRLTNRLARAQC
jgi:hypothetical protein